MDKTNFTRVNIDKKLIGFTHFRWKFQHDQNKVENHEKHGFHIKVEKTLMIIDGNYIPLYIQYNQDSETPSFNILGQMSEPTLNEINRILLQLDFDSQVVYDGKIPRITKIADIKALEDASTENK